MLIVKGTIVSVVVGVIFLGSPLEAQGLPRNDESVVAQSDEEGEVQRNETIVNTNPLFLQEQLPGFSMKESIIERSFRANGSSKDTIYEVWIKPAPDAASGPTSVKLALHLEKNRNKALKIASGVYDATLEPNQAPLIGKPFPSSYSGDSIGDYCWCYKAAFKRAGTNLPMNPIKISSSLIVVEKDNCFSLLLTGSGDGQGIEDRETERLAKKLVHRLKTWARPQ